MNKFLSSVVTLVGLTLAAAASAQNAWPSKPVRIVVPYAPGGVTDSVARIVAQGLSESLGQPFVVDNRPGAGGTLGTEAVAKSAADGYTFLMGSAGPQTLAQYVQKVRYDGLKDFAPVSNVNSSPLVLMVNNSVSAKTVPELVELAKSKPEGLSFSSAGAGGLTHFSGELFSKMANVKMLHVPYRGGAPATLALVAGEVNLTFANYSDALAQLKGGRLKAIAITGAKRFPQSPDIPTIAESGLAGYAVDSWNGLLAPAGTPAPIVERLSAAVQKVLREPSVRKQMTEIGAEPIGDTPQQFTEFIKKEMARWDQKIRETGIRYE